MPARCGRIWIHTHPGNSAQPSLTDERTFARVFGQFDWAAMVIVARGGETYSRLSFTAGPGWQQTIPLHVDWERFPSDLLENEGRTDDLFAGWMDEYGRNVHWQKVWWKDNASFSPSKRSISHLEPIDPLDLLYDSSILDDQFLSWIEERDEVFP